MFASMVNLCIPRCWSASAGYRHQSSSGYPLPPRGLSRRQCCWGGVSLSVHTPQAAAAWGPSSKSWLHDRGQVGCDQIAMLLHNLYIWWHLTDCKFHFIYAHTERAVCMSCNTYTPQHTYHLHLHLLPAEQLWHVQPKLHTVSTNS